MDDASLGRARRNGKIGRRAAGSQGCLLAPARGRARAMAMYRVRGFDTFTLKLVELRIPAASAPEAKAIGRAIGLIGVLVDPKPLSCEETDGAAAPRPPAAPRWVALPREERPA